MDFLLSKEQKLLQKMMADFTEKEVKPIAGDTDRDSQRFVLRADHGTWHG